MLRLAIALAIVPLTLTTAAHAVSPAADGAQAKRELSYGTGSHETLDYYPAARADAPLVIFVHGGGWKRGDKGNATGAAKVQHFHANGYAVASLDYPLVPGATVEQQAQDVADAVAWLIAHKKDLGFDPARIVLMGHSAGAHLSALVGTDPQYLRKAGLGMDRLRGVVLLDGAAYDVPAQIAQSGAFMRGTYVQAFGENVTRQRALSPYYQAAAPNAPAFLILHVERDDGTRQSTALADALRKAGADVTLQGFAGKGLMGHMAINRQLGEPDYPATPVVDQWLARIFR